MPAYSFKERFVPMVKDGSKSGTIRSFRKYPPRVGQLAHLFYGMRTKFCTKLVTPEPVISSVKVILITETRKVVILDTDWIEEGIRAAVLRGDYTLVQVPFTKLGQDEKDQLAWDDGFRHSDAPTKTDGCFELMVRFWRSTHALPFLGNYIKWDK